MREETKMTLKDKRLLKILFIIIAIVVGSVITILFTRENPVVVIIDILYGVFIGARHQLKHQLKLINK